MASLDYGVLNALNLINKNLGEAYETRGFNPFVDNFVLDKRLAEKLVAMKKEKRAVPPPEFLEQGQEEILRRIKNAKRRLLNIILALEKTKNHQPEQLHDRLCTELHTHTFHKEFLQPLPYPKQNEFFFLQELPPREYLE